jgi:hypothetical protein
MDRQQMTRKFSPEVRERAVRMVKEHAGEHATEAISLISAIIVGRAETLRILVRSEQEARLMTDERGRLRALEREKRELR